MYDLVGLPTNQNAGRSQGEVGKIATPRCLKDPELMVRVV
jgi:hypothetical protein